MSMADKLKNTIANGFFKFCSNFSIFLLILCAQKQKNKHKEILVHSHTEMLKFWMAFGLQCSFAQHE